MSGVFHLWAYVNRLYVNQGKGGEGWMSVDDVVRVEKHSLSDYLERGEIKSKGVLNVFVKKGKY